MNNRQARIFNKIKKNKTDCLNTFDGSKIATLSKAIEPASRETLTVCSK